MRDEPLEKLNSITGVAESLTPASIATPHGHMATQQNVDTEVPEEPTPTITSLLSNQLEERRKAANKEKTDAVKMQKYYALTDALRSLGQMGGAIVGGAIGGNVLDSAPQVGEYKESRGYINAFEKAKQANDRLRRLDEEEFNLAVADAERNYKQQQDKLYRDFQKEMADYKAKIEQATYANNLALKSQYEAEAAEAEQQYWEERAAINHKYGMEEKEYGRGYAQYQKDLYADKDNSPIIFKGGSIVNVPKKYHDAIRTYLMDEKIGEITVDKYNVDSVIKNNPKMVYDLLEKFGFDVNNNTEEPAVETSSSVKSNTQTQKQPNVSKRKRISEEDNVEPNVVIESTRFGYPTDIQKAVNKEKINPFRTVRASNSTKEEKEKKWQSKEIK